MDVLELLLELCSATTPPTFSTSPRYIFQWPILKYLHFFVAKRMQLHAGPEASWYVQHGRTAVSDELGVAFSLLAARRWVGQGLGLSGITFYDVEGCLAGRYLGAGPKASQRSGHSQRPDWIVAAADPKHPKALQYYALESKGTKFDIETQHCKSLAKAVEQLAGVTVGNQSVPGLAVRTVSGEGRIKVLAIDPPPEEAPAAPTQIINNDATREYLELLASFESARLKSAQKAATDYPSELNPMIAAEKPPPLRDPQHDRRTKSEESGGRKPGNPADISLEELTRHASATNAIRMARWSADAQIMSQLSGDTRKVTRGAGTTSIETGGTTGSAVGTTISLPGERARLFTGILETFVAPLKDLDFEAIAEFQSHLTGSLAEPPDSTRSATREAGEHVLPNVRVSPTGLVAAIIP